MGFFSDLWDGVKDIAGGIANIVGTVVEKLFEGAFWLIGVIFDAVESLFEWIDDAIDTVVDIVGSFFTSPDKPGEGVILPPTPEVVEVVKKYDKEYGTDYHRKVREGKGSLAAITDGNGKVVGSQILGSDKGFDSTISAVHKRNRSYATRIK